MMICVSIVVNARILIVSVPFVSQDTLNPNYASRQYIFVNIKHSYTYIINLKHLYNPFLST